MQNILKSKKAKIAIVAVLLILALVFAKKLFVYAQSVIDSFNDQTKIAATWNLSTTTPGEIKLAAKTCDIFSWFCSASTTCANTLGDGHYIIVAQSDATTSLAWKTAGTACNQPQCGINGGQDGDNLKADNTLNFASYPARNYCKAIGGRLPTIDELECIYDNQASFGSFEAGYYWSSTEASVTDAWSYYFPGADRTNYTGKTDDYYVRCVRGW
jgi:hypothetical protein